MSNLYRGNIGLILVIVIAWLLHICFYMDEEFGIINEAAVALVLSSHLFLLWGVVVCCKYLLPIAIVFFIGNLYAVLDMFNAMVPYGGSNYLDALESSGRSGDSVFLNYWDIVVQHYISYFQGMQEALLVSVLITVLWWTSKYNFDNEVKNLWAGKTSTKIISIVLLFVFAVTISIPYWIVYTIDAIPSPY